MITGASRGYGRCIAESLAACIPAASALLLLARNTHQLTEVVKQLQSQYNDVKVAYSTFDQSILAECSHDNVSSILSKADINLKDFDTVVVVHNSGTTGDLTKYVWEMSEISTVENAMNVNVTGMVLLNAALLREIRKHAVETTVVVNISSLAAVQAFPSWSLYCAGRLAFNQAVIFISAQIHKYRNRLLSICQIIGKYCRKSSFHWIYNKSTFIENPLCICDVFARNVCLASLIQMLEVMYCEQISSVRPQFVHVQVDVVSLRIKTMSVYTSDFAI